MMEQLPKKQREVLEAIIAFIKDNGYPPTIQQLCDLCGVTSTSTIHYHLSALKKKEFIHWNDSERRAITVRDDLLQQKGEIPIWGTIAAGVPIHAMTDDVETLNLSEDLCSQEAYALRVKGESMIEDHIMDGDIVLINPKSAIRNGDVVVALVEGHTSTLKRYYRKQGQIRLEPANATMEPLVLPEDLVTLQGKVEAVVRQVS